MAHVTDSNEWRKLWEADKRGMIDIMRLNLAADITVGYSLDGQSVRHQVNDILDYELEFKLQCEQLDFMEEPEQNKWCFYDMKKRGVIS